MIHTSESGVIPARLGSSIAPRRQYDWAIATICGIDDERLDEHHMVQLSSDIERFIRLIVVGLNGIVALDVISSGSGAQVVLLVGAPNADGLQVFDPFTQLNRFRSQISQTIATEAGIPEQHFARFSRLPVGYSFKASITSISHGALSARAIVPCELAPSGTGMLGQLIEGSQAPCALRLIIVPRDPAPIDSTALNTQLADLDELCHSDSVPAAVQYRALQLRTAILRMTDTLLGQACAAQIQVRGASEESLRLLRRVLTDELARPKDDELAVLRGVVTYHSGTSLPPLVEPPECEPLSAEVLADEPLPAFWLDGIGDRPRHALPVESAAAMLVPPLPRYCDIASINDRVVELRGAPRPELWRDGAALVGHDAIGAPITFDDAALARHVHLMGVPGSGKTTVMLHMLLADREAGRGFLVLDPHGDLAQRVAACAGWRRAGVMGERRFPGICLLHAIDAGHAVVERDIDVILEAICSALPPAYTGPTFRNYTRTSLFIHACAGAGEPISACIKYSIDKKVWKRVKLRYSSVIPQEIIKQADAWQSPADSMDVQILWASSKFADYFETLAADTLFAPVGQGIPPSALIMNQSQWCIDFPTLNVSMQDAGMFGQMILTAILRDVASMGIDLKRRTMVYCDEVQLFLGPAVERILQEGRKYGLIMVAGHQTSSQLDNARFDTLIGQVGLDLVFRSSLRDSESMAKHMELNMDSIATLDDFCCWVSGSVTLQRGGAFMMRSRWQPFISDIPDADRAPSAAPAALVDTLEQDHRSSDNTVEEIEQGTTPYVERAH
jgi:hypothetical protein